jgi:putative cell wall-binding protein
VTNVVRTAGANRYETASMIANEIGGDFAYVASGESGWADAVSAASLAAAQGRPVLLTARDRLPAATARGLRDLSVTSVVIVGGEASVGAAVLDAVADQNDDGFDEVAVTRVAGTDRYDTSRRMADVAISAGADPSRVWLASGHSWPDALATGPAVAARGGVFLLVPGDDLEAAPATATWLSAHAPELEEIVLVGGAASIGDRAVDQITRRVVMTRD